MDARYDPLDVLASVDAALAPGAPVLHDTAPGNVLFRREYSQGDVDGAFARADIRIRERFDHGRCSAAPLEPRGLVARWDDGRLTVWTGTQIPFVYRAALARAFGLPESDVRVVVPDTGGGFGQKMHVMPEDLAVAALARTVARPVKWIETRRENLARRVPRAGGARGSGGGGRRLTACCSGFARASCPTRVLITSSR